MAEQYLEHFGVPGMKWGHRKASSKSTSNPSSKGSQQKLLKQPKHLVRKTAIAYGATNLGMEFAATVITLGGVARIATAKTSRQFKIGKAACDLAIAMNNRKIKRLGSFAASSAVVYRHKKKQEAYDHQRRSIAAQKRSNRKVAKKG